MKTPIFTGCATAIVTPFLPGNRNEINYEKMAELIETYISYKKNLF